ncbi:DUF305 domain-containing protein [Rhizobiaceae sp. 2RAB30]
MTSRRLVIAMPTIAALGFALAGPAAAQDHSAHGAMKMGAADDNPAVVAYKQAMDKMHAAMSAMEYTGADDIDFARVMIPHHQAAIDMAQTVIEHGKDPEIRKLAEEIVAAQEAEIKQLEAWLEKHA